MEQIVRTPAPRAPALLSPARIRKLRKIVTLTPAEVRKIRRYLELI